MVTQTIVKLKPVVRFREFPFGTVADPSMREFIAERPWSNQDKALEYLRSGRVVSLVMGADLTDCLDRPHKANPLINGRREGGVTPLTDSVWFWPAGLIHFIEKYNLRLPQEFLEHAARQNWRINVDLDPHCRYDWSYFD
jgi:hypothetical protein